METYYGAQASTLNFADPKAADTINAWVKDKTKNKIDSIVNPPIDSSTKAILVNAVYFKGKWTVPFNKSSTTDRNFTASDSSESLVPMMQRGAKFSYLENSQFQAVRLPYGNDSASMYVFLPASSVLGMPKIDDFAASITQAQWQSWLPQFRETEGTVVLPKFKVEYMTSLAEALKNSGMGIAFSDAANFSGISKMPLEITDVVHKTYIETNEEGTEAAAVTGIFMGTTAVMPQQPPFYMEMNRPFFYAITDDKTGEIIFLGVMNKVDAQ